MLDYLADNLTAYLDELADYLLDEFTVVASISTLWRTLKRAKWSRKLATRRVAERDAILRAVWRGRCHLWPVKKDCLY